MFSPTAFRARLERDAAAFASHPLFASLEWGCAEREDYDEFLRRVALTHMKAPRVTALLWSLAPPAVAPGIRHRLLEESGLEAGGLDSPARLERMLRAAGLGQEVRDLHLRAQHEIEQAITRTLRCRTLRDIGFAALLDLAAFDYLLETMAARCIKLLQQHRGIGLDALTWFSRYTDSGGLRADETLELVDAYIAYYQIDAGEAQVLADAILQGNIFLQRYFGDVAVPAAASFATACLTR